MNAEDRKWLIQGALSAIVTTVATEVAKWAVEALKNRPRPKRDETGAIVIE